jgi:hypothetical protein
VSERVELEGGRCGRTCLCSAARSSSRPCSRALTTTASPAAAAAALAAGGGEGAAAAVAALLPVASSTPTPAPAASLLELAAEGGGRLTSRIAMSPRAASRRESLSFCRFSRASRYLRLASYLSSSGGITRGAAAGCPSAAECCWGRARVGTDTGLPCWRPGPAPSPAAAAAAAPPPPPAATAAVDAARALRLASASSSFLLEISASLAASRPSSSARTLSSMLSPLSLWASS